MWIRDTADLQNLSVKPYTEESDDVPAHVIWMISDEGTAEKAAEFSFLGHTEGFSLQRRLRFGGQSPSGSSCLCCWFIRHAEWIILSSRSKSVAGVESFLCEWLIRAEKSCIVSKSWPLNWIDGGDILRQNDTESQRMSCGWNSKSKDAARAGFDVCVGAWDTLLFICFHWSDVSLCRNRLYLTTVSLTENSSSSRMTLAGKRLFFLLLSLSPVCSFSLHLFPLNVPAYREKMRDLPLVSLFCSCILPEPREPAADKKEGQ